MKLRCAFILILLSATQLFAAAGRVRGTVKDVNGKPIEKASISIVSTGEINQTYTAQTNAKGEYIHIGVSPGSYKVSVAKDGYKPVDYSYVEVRVTLSDKGTTVNFKMESTAQQPGKESEAKTAVPEQSPAIVEARAGMTLLKEGKFDEAIASFQKALQLDPSLSTVHYNLGAAFERKENLPQAREHFQKAIELKPDFGDAYLALGNSYLSERKFDAPAIEALTKATELLPQNYNAFYNLGVCYANAGKYTEAEAAFRKAVALTPGEPIAHYQLGMALLGQSKNSEAKVEFLKYLELSPNAADRKDVEELLKSL
jgi:tetratricopeptide (TPR) repeat protein